jgi:hypothetical protein
MYVGQKNKGTDGQSDSTDFLARNGLAYGSWFYLRGSLPTNPGETVSGFFHSNSTDALTAEKFEDVDINPLNPTQVVLGEERTGVYVLTFSLNFSSGTFQSGESDSTYTLQMIVKDSDSPVDRADNVAWTAANLIYVANEGPNGAIWEMDSNGNNQIQIASSLNNGTGYNPSGVIDISRFVGYEPSSILLSNTMSCGSSMSVLISPTANLVSSSCPAVLGFSLFGINLLGGGNLIHDYGWFTGACWEICLFPILHWLLLFFGGKSGPCPQRLF